MININIHCDCKKSFENKDAQVNIMIVEDGMRIKCSECGDEKFIKKSSEIK